MADPNFLNQQLVVKIQSARVFFNSLRKMMKLVQRAVLIVKERHKFQILAAVPRNGTFIGSIFLDMESELIISPLNPYGYSLFFRLENWCDSLSVFVSQDPLASLYILKSQHSNDLSFVYGASMHVIKLEDAQFVMSQAVDMSINDVCVRVSMSSQRFREFIREFARPHLNNSISAVQVHISRQIMRWIGPFGQYGQSTEGYVVEGLAEGARFQFGLRWECSLFHMLWWESINYDTAVISVFNIPGGLNFYGFRFSVNIESHSLTYLESEFVLQQ